MPAATAAAVFVVKPKARSVHCSDSCSEMLLTFLPLVLVVVFVSAFALQHSASDCVDISVDFLVCESYGALKFCLK